MPNLKGEKVTLRALEPSDAAAAQAWINDPEFCRYLRDISFPFSLRAEQEWIESQVAADGEGSYTFGIEAEDRALIGTIGLHRISYKDGHAGMGVGIGVPGYRGRGYGTDAISTLLRFCFGDLRLHKVWLEVDCGNDRAIRCYERIGFRREGVMRDHSYKDKRYRDYHLMSILDREFKGWRPKPAAGNGNGKAANGKKVNGGKADGQGNGRKGKTTRVPARRSSPRK